MMKLRMIMIAANTVSRASSVAPPASDSMSDTISETSITVTAIASTSVPKGSPGGSIWFTGHVTGVVAEARERGVDPEGEEAADVLTGLFRDADRAGVTVWQDASVWSALAPEEIGVIHEGRHRLVRPRRLLLSLLPMLVVFLAWDAFGIWRGHWWYSPEYTTGIRIARVPLEEYVFFLVVPVCALLTYEAVGTVLGWLRQWRGRDA